MDNDTITKSQLAAYKPTTAYVGTSWAVMLVGVLAYLLGLWNAQSMLLNEKGYYFAVLALGLYSAISLQKNTRDEAQIRTLIAPTLNVDADSTARISNQNSNTVESGKSLFGAVKARMDSSDKDS